MKSPDMIVTIRRQSSWISPEVLRSYPNCVLVSSEGKEFEVSKWTLMATSPLFINIFAQFSEESEDLRIDVCTSSVILELLCNFMVHGVVEGVKSQMSDLLEALKLLMIDWQGLHKHPKVNYIVEYMCVVC